MHGLGGGVKKKFPTQHFQKVSSVTAHLRDKNTKEKEILCPGAPWSAPDGSGPRSAPGDGALRIPPERLHSLWVLAYYFKKQWVLGIYY